MTYLATPAAAPELRSAYCSRAHAKVLVEKFHRPTPVTWPVRHDIVDVAATAAARCFSAKVLDALGAVPDPALDLLDPVLKAALPQPRGKSSSEPA